MHVCHKLQVHNDPWCFMNEENVLVHYGSVVTHGISWMKELLQQVICLKGPTALPVLFIHRSKQSSFLLFVDCLTSQQHTGVSQGWISSVNCMCCHTEIEVADPTCNLTQSQYTNTRPTSHSAGSHWSTSSEVTGMTQPPKRNPEGGKWESTLGLSLSRQMP